MALGVRGPIKGESSPIVEVKVQGLRPAKVLRSIRNVLEGEPNKYLNVYELAELAEKTGGKLIVRPPAQPREKASLWQRMIQAGSSAGLAVCRILKMGRTRCSTRGPGAGGCNPQGTPSAHEPKSPSSSYPGKGRC